MGSRIQSLWKESERFVESFMLSRGLGVSSEGMGLVVVHLGELVQGS